MKNILVSTDFSANAHTATLYAAKLAYQAGARLVLVHAYLLPDLEEPASAEEKEEVYCWERILQAKMDQLTLELHQEYNISITRLLKPCTAPDDVLTIAEQVKAELVIKVNAQNIEWLKYPASMVPEMAAYLPLSGPAPAFKA